MALYVNVWLCGKSPLAPNDYFQVYRVHWAANNREFLCPIYIDFLKKQSVLSSEKIVQHEDHLQWEQYVDMESYAIDLIATEERIPYIIIKKPFDIVSEQSKKIDPQLFEDCLLDCDYKKLLELIQEHLERNHDYKEEHRQWALEETMKIYKFTFSEKEIWKKWYAKLIAFGWGYEEFLMKNTHLKKKEFLKTISD